MTSVSKFERVCRDSKLVPVKRMAVGSMIVLIADGYADDGPNFEGPHYTTLWACGKDEKNLVIARPLYFAGLGKTTREQRVAAAELDGVEFAKGYDARCLKKPEK